MLRLRHRVAIQTPEDRKVGYLRLTTFNNNSAKAVAEAVRDAKVAGAEALVLDLRNNGGGSFPQGVLIADEFLDDGTIVYIYDGKVTALHWPEIGPCPVLCLRSPL